MFSWQRTKVKTVKLTQILSLPATRNVMNSTWRTYATTRIWLQYGFIIISTKLQRIFFLQMFNSSGEKMSGTFSVRSKELLSLSGSQDVFLHFLPLSASIKSVPFGQSCQTKPSWSLHVFVNVDKLVFQSFYMVSFSSDVDQCVKLCLGYEICIWNEIHNQTKNVMKIRLKFSPKVITVF